MTLIDVGRLTIAWRGWARRPLLALDHYGTKETSEYRRLRVGPLAVEWWIVLP